MTVHLSPGVLHGLRLATLGIGGHERSLPVRADAQPCAPAPMPQALDRRAVGTDGRSHGRRSWSSSTRIRIFRVTPADRSGNSRKWSLHPMAPFVRLEVMTISTTTSSCVADDSG
jgi:hypothetical protein